MKFIVTCVLVWTTQLIAIIMWGQHVWLTKFANGGVGGGIFDQIHPALWWILFLELILLVSLYAVNREKEEGGHKKEGA